MEIEWKKELELLEEDKIASQREYNGLKIRLDEIDYKMEKYRVHDENLVQDRWALDPRLHYKK